MGCRTEIFPSERDPFHYFDLIASWINENSDDRIMEVGDGQVGWKIGWNSE